MPATLPPHDVELFAGCIFHGKRMVFNEEFVGEIGHPDVHRNLARSGQLPGTFQDLGSANDRIGSRRRREADHAVGAGAAAAG